MNVKIELANCTVIKYMKITSAQKIANKKEDLFKGPYQITQVWKNGTIAMHRDAVQ